MTHLKDGEITRVIKVVSIDSDGKYVSMLGTSVLGDLAREYVIGKITYPENGTLLYAYSYHEWSGYGIINNISENELALLCDAAIAVPESYEDFVPCLTYQRLYAYKGDVKEMWKAFMVGGIGYAFAPTGAIACRWIKPIQIIKHKEAE